MSWIHVAYVASESEPGLEHEIKRAADGRLGCSCGAYRFMRGAEKICKHLRAFTAAGVADTVSIELHRDVVEMFTFRRAISFGKIGAAS